MEVNKDEALRCVEVAQRYFTNGDYEKALKFVNKSISMFPTNEARQLATKIEVAKKGGSSGPSSTEQGGTSSNNKHGSGTEAKQRHTSNHSSDSHAHQGEYTKEQLAAVRKIKACKTYYEILSVEKTASDGDIKKAYRRLALQFHPDKNKAPGADEAFKAIGKAFSVLSDDNLKRQYDMYGEEGANRAQQRGASHAHSPFGADNFEAFTADEIFRMFFHGAHPNDIRANRGRQHGNRQYQFQHQQQRRQTAGDNEVSMGINFMHLLPFILMIFFTLFSGSSNVFETRVFDLRATTQTPVPRMTSNEVPYFVSTNFDHGKHDIQRVEEQVEQYFAARLRTECSDEVRKRQRLMDHARFYGDMNGLDMATNMKLPSCSRLEDLKKRQHATKSATT